MGYHTITQHEREKSDPTGVVGAEEEKREARKGREKARRGGKRGAGGQRQGRTQSWRLESDGSRPTGCGHSTVGARQRENERGAREQKGAKEEEEPPGAP